MIQQLLVDDVIEGSHFFNNIFSFVCVLLYNDIMRLLSTALFY